MTLRSLQIMPGQVLIFLSLFLDLIQASQETTVNVPQMADTLMERAGNASWVVVFKALITTHHLMVHGNEVRSTRSVVEAEELLVLGNWSRTWGLFKSKFKHFTVWCHDQSL